jgi:intracellular multiplication protein IcmD
MKRTLRPIAVVLSFALILTGCAGSNSTPASTLPAAPYLMQAPTTLDSFTSTTPLTVSSVGPVVPLFAIPDIQTNEGNASLVMWGSKDASGNITDVTQAGITDVCLSCWFPSGTVQVYFDASQHPVLFRDDSSGYSLLFSYDSPTQLTVTLCDPSGNGQGYATVNPTTQTVADGGSCVLQNILSRHRIAATRVHAQSSGSCSSPPATNVCNLSNLAQLMTANSYVAGMAFAIGAIAKFKAHKDNPTQIPIGTPIALLFVAAALIFIPTIFSTAGSTLFGSTGSSGSTEINVDSTPPSSELGTPYASYVPIALDASGGFQ